MHVNSQQPEGNPDIPERLNRQPEEGPRSLDSLTQQPEGESSAPVQQPEGNPDILDRLPRWVFTAMLFVAAIVWGSGFFVMKEAVELLQPSTLVGVRYLMAAVLMFLLFRKRILSNLGSHQLFYGAVLGVVYYIAFLLQTQGLTDTTPGKNAFLTATYAVMTPFVFWVVARRRPALVNVVVALVCLVGIGFVSLDGDLAMRWGDALTLACAVFFALHIALLGKYTQGIDVFLLTFMQFAACGVCGLVFGLAFEAQPPLESVLTPSVVGQLVWLAVVCSVVASLGQNVGQTRVPPSQAALILSLESVFGVLFSVLFYGEVLTVRLVVGFAIIFAAIVWSELAASRREAP